MGDLSNLLPLLLTAMLVWTGVYAIYSAIRLHRQYDLFDNRILYPANCAPKDCRDVVGFVGYMVPRLWIFGGVCLAIGGWIAASDLLRLIPLPRVFDVYVLPFLGLIPFVWYIVVINRAAKKFW